VAVNPLTERVYVTNLNSNDVTVIDGATGAVVAPSIAVGVLPVGVAVTPTTNRVYVSNNTSNTVSVIDGATNTASGAPIAMSTAPVSIAENGVTHRLYVTSFSVNTITVIDTTSRTVVGAPISVGTSPAAIAVNPLINRIYVADPIDDTMSVIDGSTDTIVGTPIQVGLNPRGITVNSSTNRVYIADDDDGTVTLIDGASRTVIGTPILVGHLPHGVAVNPNTNRAYAVNTQDNTLSVISLPFAVSAGPQVAGASLTPTWSSIFAPSAGDFVGLYASSAPNISPLSFRYTNGTTSPNGAGVAAGSLNLPIPAGLPGGSYEVRLVSGTNGGTFGRARITVATAPVAANDNYPVGAGSTLSVAAPGPLANDTDADSPSLQAAVVTNPTHGTLALQADGSFTYAPGASFVGTDSFTYRAIDETGLASTATVSVTAAVPSAASDTFAIAASGTLSVPAPGVLSNDTDVDSPTLQAVVVSNPAHGALVLQPDGSFTYTPAADFAGTDSFTYRATGQTNLASTATVSIVVTPIFCGPRPTVQVQTSAANGALQVTVVATDVNGPTQNELREIRFSDPVNGRVTVAGQTHTSAFVDPVPAGTARVTFSVQRVTAGQATTIPLTVTDICGAWPTFVGGGPSAGF
jgi:YVTN family beta-propeller protein